jgi:NAD(P)-dependent dehydrogenase (short-subunit alcohol dehydrogenase family)
MTRLANTTALITGGTTGIGFAAAERLIVEGARVLFTGQDSARVADAAARLGPNAAGLVADQAGMDFIAPLAAAVKERFGRLDTLVLNAGIAPLQTTLDAGEAAYDRLFAVNVKAPFYTVQALAPLLADGGSIIAVTSVLDQVASAGLVPYGATKAALRSYVRSWAVEFQPRGIRANAVAPGPITTPIYGKLGLDQATLEEAGKQLLTKVPMGRFGAPEEIAGIIAFLASKDASYVTGADIVAGGGWGEV